MKSSEALNEQERWHPKTARTLIGRLVKKRALTFKEDGRAYCYRPGITEAEAISHYSQSFLERVFDGGLGPHAGPLRAKPAAQLQRYAPTARRARRRRITAWPRWRKWPAGSSAGSCETRQTTVLVGVVLASGSQHWPPPLPPLALRLSLAARRRPSRASVRPRKFPQLVQFDRPRARFHRPCPPPSPRSPLPGARPHPGWPPPPTDTPPWFLGALALWFPGALILAALLWRDHRNDSNLPIAGAPVGDSEALDLLTQSKAVMGVRRHVELVESSRITSPAIAGWWRPQLLLPVGLLPRLTPDETRFLFLHELAHVKIWRYCPQLAPNRQICTGSIPSSGSPSADSSPSARKSATTSSSAAAASSVPLATRPHPPPIPGGTRTPTSPSRVCRCARRRQFPPPTRP